ncbi:chemosensory pili system protein ChpA (sensor histidine kinase/response regulator) [Halopseudomonas litoralis]|uniref:Chemotaxis protein CheA n=2 Tax=Halopseudomonas litoralis TaxID=797277 RepID=A0A1H1XLJ8_9GAMM|nr:chemosensory pili system protein ChpA (sensor histidine kinase/response regulator) [Halopseudomonas litoralis]
MGDRHDYVALDWVKGEISETLNQARHALETFVENPEDTTRLRFCLTYIHQVHGTLQMVEFYGAALLAEEMEKLAQALMHGTCRRENEALEVLMQAILQMPAYLDRVQSGRRDLPLLLLPLLNDMRTARGEKLLSENALFSPELNTDKDAGDAQQVDFGSEQVARQLRKLRQAMQIAHAAIIREQNVPASSHQLGRVFMRLEGLFQGTRFAELWSIFAGVAEGLELGSIDNGAAIRQLLRQADRELRQLQDETAAIADSAPAPELLRNLLFYVAKSSGSSPRLDALKKHYRLNPLWSDTERQAQASDSRMVGPDRGTMQSVVQALDEELLQVKERLDLFVRSSERRPDALESLLPAMKRIADTLAVLGLGQPRRVLQEQIKRVETLASADSTPSDAQLMEIAGGVLYVEASMRGIFAMDMDRSADAPGEDDDQPRQLAGAQDLLQIQQQVVLEARNALEQTREAVNAFIAGQWDHTQLQPVDELLNSVRGGLAMLPLARAADAVAACRLYLSQQLIRDRKVPDWEALDALADVITSIDYYLERVVEDNADRGDSILAVAEERLALLGYAPGAIGVLDATPAVAAAAVPANAVSVAVDEPDEDELDPELLEIFVEEVGEVLETLDDHTPRWQADAQDTAARAEVRRGFHTLKGSGRMVRAGVLAELAWAVENMLNRVIDGNVPLSQPIFATVNAVRALIPALLEDFAAGRQQQLPEVERLADQADALSRGASLPAFDEAEEPISAAVDPVDTVLPEAQTEIVPLPEADELPMAFEPSFETEQPYLPDDLSEAVVASEPEQSEPLEEEPPAVVLAVTEEADEAQTVVAETVQAELDPLLLKIFRTETQTHIEQINGYIGICDQNGLPYPLSDTLQRALHTLKGSAHMAGIQPIAVLATPLEKLAKDFKGNLIPADQAVVELLRDAVSLLETWLARVDAASDQTIPGTETFLQRLDVVYQDAMQKHDNSRSDLDGSSDAVLLSIFLTEGVDLLLDAADELALWSPAAAIDHTGLARALRGLSEVAAEVELMPIEELCQGLEDAHAALASQRLLLSPEVADCLAQSHERLIGMMDQVAAHQHVHPARDELNALQALFQASNENAPVATVASTGTEVSANTWNLSDVGTDAELVDIFLEEAQEILDTSSSSLQHWLTDTSDEAPLHALLRDLHTLKGGARMAEIRPVGDLTHELEFLYDGLVAQRFAPVEGLPELLLACQDGLTEMVEGIVADRSISDGMQLIRVIRDFRAQPDRPPQWPTEAVADPLAAETAEAPMPEPPIALAADSGMLGMFIEEARELLQPCADLLTRRETEPAAADELLHRIQTLKGSARLASHKAVAEQARLLETTLQQSEPGQDDSLSAMLAELQSSVEQLAGGQLFPSSDWTLPAVAPAAPLPIPAAPERTLAEIRTILQQAMDGAGPSRTAGSRGGMQETIKVPAGLLEELVNLAGETSIFRGRVEQQVSDISQTLTDMESTIERVRDQLRRLDMETQAQILSRHQEEIEQGYEDFDPLEMDRYSQLQQLSRSLFESASDMLDLKETLATRSRDAETLLLQQARVNTELQEGLMRTRMVPFERLLPRLRRVVRQVSTELGKQVSLVVGNAEGEMDRSVLERMMGPLEHMLRNAVDHGIELPALRTAQGKPEEGRVSLDVHREGSEIVIRLHDDGGGVDLQAVRSKAIERGLMDADAGLTDQEVLQFILEAGFSTAEQVTQISGRGVGMDVVNAEIKQLGGSMTLSTEPGLGTSFLIRLPFTVSVNRALMVYSGKDLYAIPLNTIEGIVRVSGYELEAYYSPDAPAFEYAGKNYDLRYLGDLLVTGQQPKLAGHSLPLPVILVRGTEHSVAVQVDALAGSREIVVKSLGKQFAVVPGISGATILGDGRVVVILDLLAVIRAQQALYSQQQLAAERAISAMPQARRSTLVMVVDDSITVRKVTTRLLERHGMEVVTAKDGVDAIARLQDVQPDIMLLDIEMPRMDGFEVATRVRHDERLKDLPIVMITSRTGEKHRERARSLGVNEYLGKPYQEPQLLEVIGNLVNLRD